MYTVLVILVVLNILMDCYVCKEISRVERRIVEAEKHILISLSDAKFNAITMNNGTLDAIQGLLNCIEKMNQRGNKKD